MMKNSLLIACVFGLFTATITLAQIVPMQQDPVPPGAIPASQARNNVGKNVTACGFGSYPVSGLNGIDLGTPGNGGTVGADLIMILPQDLNPGMYLGKKVCVNGAVVLQTFLNSQVPVITAQSAQDISVY
jgi:hypothetical protein